MMMTTRVTLGRMTSRCHACPAEEQCYARQRFVSCLCPLARLSEACGGHGSSRSSWRGLRVSVPAPIEALAVSPIRRVCPSPPGDVPSFCLRKRESRCAGMASPNTGGCASMRSPGRGPCASDAACAQPRGSKCSSPPASGRGIHGHVPNILAVPAARRALRQHRVNSHGDMHAGGPRCLRPSCGVPRTQLHSHCATRSEDARPRIAREEQRTEAGLPPC